ncbi:MULTISPECIES: phage Gp37/Gp68 family protein [Mesorhizobium]|uniref:phage Gp37/Gp68 family protein n=1 Tax=Mesorhizobium TaxID=68287 RepID=UPI0010A9535B|nr:MULTISPECIES: phage Gp37/Gp68 family protein [Mesorhizobium]
MADKSAIEWTDATWNPVVGCSIVSPGCTNCYAMKMAGRIEAMGGAKHYAGTTKKVNGNTIWTGKLALAPEKTLLQPLTWRAPRRIFVNSMGDLFHEDVPDEWIDRVFAIMALAPQHTFQVLTKRATRMREYLTEGIGRIRAWTPSDAQFRAWCLMPSLAEEAAGCPAPAWPLPNVWLGVSAERQQEADERVSSLLFTPAAIRFVSAEPLLSEINFRRISLGTSAGTFIDHPEVREAEFTIDALGGAPRSSIPGLDMIIAGGESGPKARPMHPNAPRRIRDDCTATGKAFFFKQWGEYLPVGQNLPGHGKVHGATAVKPGRMKLHYGGTPQQAPRHAFADGGVEFASTSDGHLTFRVGKKAAGRLLDGIEHKAFPNLQPVE